MLLASGRGWAHGVDASSDSPAWALHWSFDPLVVALLALGMGLYASGYWKLRARSSQGRTVRRRQGCAFMVGWLALVVALLSPLDALGALLFSAHMLQHETLMIVAAPLLVLGRPLAVWLWAFGPRERLAIARAVRWPGVAGPWRWLTAPAVAWALHAAAVWAWHVPRWFEAALHRPAVHTLQHASFLASALLFWWAVLGVRKARGASGHALLLLFTTMAYTGALGALLTLAPVPWYPTYAQAAAWGFDPLEDQQLGGLVMWVPGGLAYVFAGLAVAAQWLARRSGPDAPEWVSTP